MYKDLIKAPGRLVAFCCLMVLASQAFAEDRAVIYEQARQLIAEGNSAAAYQLLLKQEVEWSGEDDYDYLFGIAALDSGEPSEAVFSLQRLIARQPEFSGARLELARAYFDLGDNELARKEFEQILTEDPPENVVEASNDYLKAIDIRARTYQSDIQYTFDFGFGYDNNAPAATADDIFLNFLLAPNNLAQSSKFASTAFAANYNRPIGPETQILANARFDHRSNPSTHFVDASNADVGLGWMFNRGPHTVSVAANRLFSFLDGTHNKKDTGLSLSYVRKLNDAWSLIGFVRASEVRFEEAALQIQDVDRVSYGFTISQTFSAALLNVTATGGTDDSQTAGAPFSLDTYGISVSNTWYRPTGTAIFVEASASETEFDDPFFGIARDDELKTFAVGMTFNKFPSGDWVTTLKANYSHKDSTVSLYEFDRLELGVTLQKIF